MGLSLGIKDLKEESKERQKEMPLKKPILYMMDELASSVRSESNEDLIALIFATPSEDSDLSEVRYEFTIFPRIRISSRTNLFSVVFSKNANPRFETRYTLHPSSLLPVDCEEIKNEADFRIILKKYIESEPWKVILSKLLDNIGD